MALAWKAGWVHALTSSNLVSSAILIPALTWAGIVIGGLDSQPEPDFVPPMCPQFERLCRTRPRVSYRASGTDTYSTTQRAKLEEVSRALFRTDGETSRIRGRECPPCAR